MELAGAPGPDSVEYHLRSEATELPTMLAFLFYTFVILWGFVMIALTQKRPRKLLMENSDLSPQQKLRYRFTAVILLFLSFASVIAEDGWSFEVIVWGTLVSIAAFVVCLALTLCATPIRRLLSR